jgi:hypothetical protein
VPPCWLGGFEKRSVGFCAEILRVGLLGNTSIVSMSSEIFADAGADDSLPEAEACIGDRFR